MQQQIKIEMTDEILDREKKDGTGTYVQQVAYAHTLNESGEPHPHPEKIYLYRPNRAECLRAGDYSMLPSSIIVSRNQLTIGRLKLVPIKTESSKTA